MDNKNYFNSVAGNWDKIRTELFPDSIRDKALSTAGNLNGKIAADIGAGTGFLSEALLMKGAKVISVDHSEEMIHQLRQKFYRNNNIDIRAGSDTSLPILNSSVNFVFANMFLHHVEDPQSAISEMARILKPGGKIILTDLDEHNYDFLVKEQFDRWMGFKRENIQQWFEQSGLTNILVDCANADCCSSSSDGKSSAEISVFIATASKPEGK